MRNFICTCLVLLGLLFTISEPVMAWEPPEDPRLDHLAYEYKRNFNQVEQALQKNRDAMLQRIDNDPNIPLERKNSLSSKVQEHYRAASAANVAKYREPLISRMMLLSNHESNSALLSRSSTLKDSVGTRLWSTDEKTGKKVLNPKYRGATGDRDLQGGVKQTERLAKLAEKYGFRPERSADTLDVKELELTVNKNVDRFDKPGSDAHEIKIRSLAANKESYLMVSMVEGQPGRQAVHIMDDAGKGLAYRASMTSGSIAERTGGSYEQRQEFQAFNKGTLKAIETAQLADDELARQLRASGYEGTVADYKKNLAGLKLGARPEALGLDTRKLAAIEQANSAVQDLAVRKAQAIFKEQIQSEQQTLHEQQTRLNKLKSELGSVSGEAREARQADIRRLEAELNSKAELVMDSKVRMKAISDVREAALGRQPEWQPPSRGQLLSPDDARSKLRNLPATAYTKGLGAAGKAGDIYTIYTTGQQAYQQVMQGEYGAAAKVVADAVADEVYGRIKPAVMNALVPGSGQIYGAFTAGYSAGEVIGGLRFGNDDPTVNQTAENGFSSLFSAMEGTTGQIGYNQVIDQMVSDVKNGARLPAGMTLAQASETIRKNLAEGRFVMTGVELDYTGGEQKPEQLIVHPVNISYRENTPAPVQTNSGKLNQLTFEFQELNGSSITKRVNARPVLQEGGRYLACLSAENSVDLMFDKVLQKTLKGVEISVHKETLPTLKILGKRKSYASPCLIVAVRLQKQTGSMRSETLDATISYLDTSRVLSVPFMVNHEGDRTAIIRGPSRVAPHAQERFTVVAPEGFEPRDFSLIVDQHSKVIFDLQTLSGTISHDLPPGVSFNHELTIVLLNQYAKTAKGTLRYVVDGGVVKKNSSSSDFREGLAIFASTINQATKAQMEQRNQREAATRERREERRSEKREQDEWFAKSGSQRVTENRQPVVPKQQKPENVTVSNSESDNLYYLPIARYSYESYGNLKVACSVVKVVGNRFNVLQPGNYPTSCRNLECGLNPISGEGKGCVSTVVYKTKEAVLEKGSNITGWGYKSVKEAEDRCGEAMKNKNGNGTMSTGTYWCPSNIFKNSSFRSR